MRLTRCSSRITLTKRVIATTAKQVVVSPQPAIKPRRAIAALGLERYVLPARAFLPLNWWDVKESFAAGAGASAACYPGKYGVEAFCVAELRRPDVYGVHWFRAILRKRGLPYETADADRPVRDSLYERMIARIEDDAGLARNSL